MRDLLMCAFFVIGVMLAVTGVVIGAALLVDMKACERYATVTGTQTVYDFGTCYVHTADGYMPYGEYKARAYTNEAR